MKRSYGWGQIYEKWGAYYGRWRTPDGQRVNRRLRMKRTRGGSDGLTRAQAAQAMRRLQAEDAARRPIEPVVEIVTVDLAAERLRERITIEAPASPTRDLNHLVPTFAHCASAPAGAAVGVRSVPGSGRKTPEIRSPSATSPPATVSARSVPMCSPRKPISGGPARNAR